MTKYVLVGGADSSAPEQKKIELANELKSNIDSKTVKILSVLFALSRENWEKYYESRKTYFQNLFTDNFKIEMANPKEFEKQALWADVIYLHGGDETLLSHWLEQYDLELLFSKKVVVGSSAGAEYLSKNFNTCDWREIKNGKGLAGANVIVHFGSEYGKDDPRGPIDWQKMRQELKEFDPSTKLYCLREGEFVVIEK